MNKKSFWILTLSLVLVKILIHFFTSTNYELHRDEMLYFSMGSHLSWGFASTPPFMSLLAFIIKSVFGYHPFFVKLFPALFGASILLLIALFIKELGGTAFAVFTGCFAYIISTAMLRTASLFMPVIFELFFWMLFLFFVLKLILTQNPKYWIFLGIIFGMAFLNKYSVLFLGFSTCFALLISEHRRLLVSRYFIYAVLISLLIMTPNILWQINHNMAVMTHMRELYRTQFVYVSKQSFLLGQLWMNCTSILFWTIGLIVVLFKKSEKKYRVFGTIFLLVIFMFLIAEGKFYYTLGVYPMMFAFGGYYLGKSVIGKLKSGVYSIVGVSFLLSVLFLPLGLPILPKEQMGRYCALFSKYITPAPMQSENNSYYPIPQDYMDMTGWNELAKLASTAYKTLDVNQQRDCIIYANNYGQAGAIDFYGKQYNLPTPICLNDSYIFWAPDSLRASNFIVTDEQFGDIPRLFNKYSEVGEIKDSFFRENGLKVFLCQYPKPLLNEFFIKRIKENKEVYGF
jgi:4-amino-4-deoxy-L-arabinose transferase-like glycosyltransferase